MKFKHYSTWLKVFSIANTLLLCLLIFFVAIHEEPVPPVVLSAEALKVKQQQDIEIRKKFSEAYSTCASNPEMSKRLFCDRYAQRVAEGK